MEEIFKRVLDKLRGADFWIALFFIAAGIVSWKVIGTTKAEEKYVLYRRLGVAVTLSIAAISIIAVRRFFNRERPFSQNLTGILVMRIAGDDANDSLQKELIANLNAELQKESTGRQVEVHASRKMLDESRGRAAAHRRARHIGQRRKAALVIWGQKIGDKKFFPRITVITKKWIPMSERTHHVQSITEVGLPEILVDEPFYLIHLAVGCSYYREGNYQDALPRFKAALQRKGASPNELAELQFLTGFCDWSLSVSQKNESRYLEEAIELFEKAAKAFERVDQEKWAMTQNNLGVAYRALQIGDPVANVQRAIAACEAALSFFTEENFPVDWAGTQNNLGVAYFYLPTGHRAANLEKAITAYEAALRVRTENEFPIDWATTQNNLGNVYCAISPAADRAVNVQKAITAYEAALRVRTEQDLPVDWAMTQNNLGNAYRDLPVGDQVANFQKAIAAYEAALSVYTEKEFPFDWAGTQNNIGNAYRDLPIGDRAANLHKAITAYEAALRVRTQKEFPVDWAMTQNNLGLAYLNMPTGDSAANLQKAIAAFEAALSVYTEKDFPVEWARAQGNLGVVYLNMPIGNRAANLQKAIAAHQAALSVYTEKDFPVEWAKAQINLGLAYGFMNDGGRTNNLINSKNAFEAALRVFDESRFPEYHRLAAEALAEVDQQLRGAKSDEESQ
jgi:tetratricopeptide (TPR) repeat protein